MGMTTRKSMPTAEQLRLFDEQSAPAIPCFFTQTAELTAQLLSRKRLNRVPTVTNTLDPSDPPLTLEQRLRHARAH